MRHRYRESHQLRSPSPHGRQHAASGPSWGHTRPSRGPPIPAAACDSARHDTSSRRGSPPLYLESYLPSKLVARDIRTRLRHPLKLRIDIATIKMASDLTVQPNYPPVKLPHPFLTSYRVKAVAGTTPAKLVLTLVEQPFEGKPVPQS